VSAPPQQLANVVPQQPANIPRPPQTVQPLSESAFEQAAQDSAAYIGMAPSPGQWSAPAATPTAGELPPVEAGWEAPATVAPVAPDAPPSAVDALIAPDAAAPSAAVPAAWAPAAGAAAVAGPAITADAVVGDQAAVEPLGRRAAIEDTAPRTNGSNTLWVWLIAISPIIAALAIGYVIVSTGYVATGWPFEAAIAAPYLLVLLFALADRSALLTLGHSSPRSPGWALLTAPVYLIMRAAETRQEDGTGTRMTIVWFISFVVAIAGFVGWGLLTHHPLIASLPS
jgi:hypothetical protein